MNKIGLRRQIYVTLKKKNPKITKDLAYDMVDTVIQTMFDALINTQRLTLRDFGAFEVKHCKERLGWHPVKKEHMVIKDRVRIKFKPSSALLLRVNTKNQK